jgi:hypothetical protein
MSKILDFFCDVFNKLSIPKIPKTPKTPNDKVVVTVGGVKYTDWNEYHRALIMESLIRQNPRAFIDNNAIVQVDTSIEGDRWEERIVDINGNTVTIVNGDIVSSSTRIPPNNPFDEGFSQHYDINGRELNGRGLYQVSSPNTELKPIKTEDIIEIQPITNSITSLDIDL